MKFKTINIENFRGIKRLELAGLSKINVLLGQNNTGKSSILEAIFLLCGFNNPQLALNIDLFRNLVHTKEDDFRFLFYDLDYESKVLITGILNQKEAKRQLEIRPKENQSRIVGNKINIC